jgi:hypothetical protein
MDPKDSQPMSYDHEIAPPSYTETVTSSSSYLFPRSASSASHYYGANIQDQLRSLTAQIRSAQTQISIHNHGNDERMLALLTTEIQLFFSGFADSGLQRGTLIMVPAGAVQEGAMPMEYDFKNPEEYDQVVRVRSKEEKERGEWYWRNEEMAKRLARYLSPTPSWKELPSRRDDSSSDGDSAPGGKVFVKRKKGATSRVDQGTANEGATPAPRHALRRRQKPIEETQKQSRGIFFRNKGTISSIERPPAAEERDVQVDPDAKVADASPDDKIGLNVKAEEVSFRTENHMGIFETQRGWAVVLKLNVELSRR